MNKKTVFVTVVVLSVIAVISLGVIVINLFNTENGENNVQSGEHSNGTDTSTSNNGSNNEKATNVVLTSTIGIKILENLKLPNLYSDDLNKEVEKNGITDKFIREYVIMQVLNNEKYSKYLKENEQDMTRFITAEDLKNIASEIFENGKNIVNGDTLSLAKFNINKLTYEILSLGFTGNDFNFVIFLPYEIKEYENRVEVYMYKVYITRKTRVDGENEVTSDEIYYDLLKNDLAISVIDENMYDEDTQREFVKGKIDDGSIKRDKLKKAKVTMLKKDGKYLISKYE